MSPKKTEPPDLYWAYGSNLNPHVMRVRCPGAKRVGKLTLPHGLLTFRGVADVEITKDKNNLIPGGLWEVTQECEKHLDKCEGYFASKETNHYDKRYLILKLKGKERRCFFYQRRKDRNGIAPPDVNYYESIRVGYKYFGIDESFLEEALVRSYEQKLWTPGMRKRWKNRGKIKLARPKRPSLQSID
jgi:Gamma-glutamyl cyclotransferase, AIG2-like